MAEITIDDISRTVRDGVYIGIGLGVIAFQKAQVRRQELRKQVETNVKTIEERLEVVEDRIDSVLDDVEERLPEQARSVMHQAREVAKDARTQLLLLGNRAG